MADEMINVKLSEVVRLAVETGIRMAHDEMKKQRKEMVLKQYENRLSRTNILLKNYRNIQEHCRYSIYDKKSYKNNYTLNAYNILQELDTYEWSENQYIESIKKSCQRTAIILEHINKMMDIFQGIMIKDRNIEKIRKYKVIKMKYIDNNWSADKIAEELKTSKAQIYRDINDGTEILASLIFGIDGLNMI